MSQGSHKRNRLATPVFVFEDHVDYLRAWYDYAKRYRLTQQAFMQRTGIGSQAYFSDILARRKKLAIKHIEGFAAALELCEDEAEYFSLLVQKDHTEKGPPKEQILKQLALYREKHLPHAGDEAGWKRSCHHATRWEVLTNRNRVMGSGTE